MTLKINDTLKLKLNRFITTIQHSRKQQMALFVVSFAAIGGALYFVYASPKSAAEWNMYAPTLRQCESGGDYRNKNNTLYRGAYQFSYGTWESLGGTGDPADAEPKLQDQLAYKLYLGADPFTQWPVCWRQAQYSPYYGPADSTGGYSGTVTTTSPSNSINNPGTDCHNYTLQYDPSNYYPCVQHLQNDIHINPDGYFGPGTKAAVIQVQANARPPLAQTGIVDSATWCAIHNDLPGCGSLAPPAPAAVTVTPTSTSQAVQGRIFRDDNANGIRDSTEPLIGNAGNCGSYLNVDASIAAAGQLVNADRCNAPGPFYFIPTPAGIQTVYANPPPGWSVTNGNSRTVNVAPGQNVDVQWFGMRPNQTTTVPTTTTIPTTSTTSNKTIVGVASGRCLDVSGVYTGDGGKVQIWGCIPGASNQQWVYDIPSKQLRVYSGTTHTKCLDIAGLNTADRAQVITWSCNGGLNQQWDRLSDGTIRSKLNGKCLDVTDESKNDGALIQMYTCLPGHDNQRWQ